MALRSVFLGLLVSLALHLSVARVILDYQVDSNDLNLIYLECFNDGETEPNRNGVFVFFDPGTGDPIRENSIIHSNDNRLSFEVTPENEAEIRCYIQNRDVTSDTVSIAGECTSLIFHKRCSVAEYHVVASM